MSAASAVIYVYYKVDAAEHAACAARVKNSGANPRLTSARLPPLRKMRLVIMGLPLLKLG